MRSMTTITSGNRTAADRATIEPAELGRNRASGCARRSCAVSFTVHLGAGAAGVVPAGPIGGLRT
jgi:hypothetical protein